MKLKLIAEEVAHYFYPNHCSFCKTKLLAKEVGVCLQCLYKIPKTNNFDERNNLDETILAGRFPFQCAASFSFFTKKGLLQALIHDLKYNKRPHIGHLVGALFGADILESNFISPIQVIVPVPLHPKKQAIRGYNQAEAFAQGISKTTSIPVSTNQLIRVINNPTQTKRSKTERWENVKGIFDVPNTHDFQNKHVLLVDDVITTGSTLEACAIALLQCNNVTISVATIGVSL
ncbi:MAG: ComF family protein [Bacteroidales bacterium]|nr:ComF family protein [Bacteroidales bacterium]